MGKESPRVKLHSVLLFETCLAAHTQSPVTAGESEELKLFREKEEKLVFVMSIKPKGRTS